MDFVQIQVSFNVYMLIHKKEGKKNLDHSHNLNVLVCLYCHFIELIFFLEFINP